ncbi:MAG: hypothetical protein DCF19_10235 [Pseudanabaena frigida]|uniref:Uncharacterized protein n=1 Tax=Pseudanabaena frigida TaxID=945775 RepID=A0A2W4WDB8_9CYAN|nr:MAG: hypothetical protein DCF19_10235 [Pseudanabaena frigida]
MTERLALISTKLVNPQLIRKLRFLPYVLIGGVVFALNASSDSHPYLQIYITLLEAKLGAVLVYLLSKKLENHSKEKHST